MGGVSRRIFLKASGAVALTPAAADTATRAADAAAAKPSASAAAAP